MPDSRASRANGRFWRGYRRVPPLALRGAVCARGLSAPAERRLPAIVPPAATGFRLPMAKGLSLDGALLDGIR